ncbi:MAG: SagB/ThcOx family dehydrogenase [Candidatus Krumholzibacteriota bacterium]
MRRFLLALPLLALFDGETGAGGSTLQQVKLPDPNRQGELSVEEGLQKRRSVREYAPGPLKLEDVAQILWAAQGFNDPEGYRTAPSAGALYPLEVYLVVGEVSDLPAGVYHYRPRQHDLVLVKSGDMRGPLFSASIRQEYVRDAPAVLAIAGVFERTARKYGQRARRYVHMEVGHAAQNVYLQAVAIGLGTVMVGAFDDGDVQKLLGLPQDHEPLALMPLGRSR